MNRTDLKARQQRRRTLRGRKAGERRGVLLLVVLSMLVLFLLLGTTFLLTSGQYRTASKIVEQENRTTFQPADLLERALMQLVRDTNNTTSVVRYHSLLRDLYGVDGFVARVYAATPTLTDPNDGVTEYEVAPRYAGVDPTADVTAAATNFGRGTTDGQIVDLFVLDNETRSSGGQSTLAEDNAVGLDFDINGLPIEHELSSIDGYYAGCLLTMLDGPCRGQSVRVVDYDNVYRVQSDPSSTPGDPRDDTVVVLGRLRVMAPARQDGQLLRYGLLPSDASGTRTTLVDFVESVSLGHRFIVNGRPFNGTGVGYNPLALSSDRSDAPMPRLSALQAMQMPDGSFVGIEHALAPHAAFYTQVENATLSPAAGTDPWAPAAAFLRLTRAFADPTAADTVALYQSYAGPGDTDESYDAPDTQNMALASQALEPRSRGRVVNALGIAQDPDAYYAGTTDAPAYLDLEGVTIPSFHRPALVNFWFHRLLRSQWLSTIPLNNRARAILEPYDAAGNPQFGLSVQQASTLTAIKRKFLLRPLREDHPDFDGSNPLSRYSSSNLRTALNTGNLVNTKGTANDDDEITFPFWEATGPWDVDNDGDGVNDSVWVDIGMPVQQTEDGRWYKPMVAMLVEDLDGRLNLNAHGSESDLVSNSLDASEDVTDPSAFIGNLAQDYNRTAPTLTTSDQLPEGSGWGTAEVSLRSILSPTLPFDEVLRGAAGFAGNPQYDDYARVLAGRPSPQTDGRTPAGPLNVAVTFGRYGSQPGSDATLALTRPGLTFREALPAIRDPRTPLEFLGYPAYTGAPTEALNGFASPLDLRGRYADGLSTVGAAINEPSYESSQANGYLPGSTWREVAQNAPDDSPYELDLSVAARRLPPVSIEAIQNSYDLGAPLVDDAPFSPAELERILRAFDADADALPDRLWEVADAFDPTKLAAQRRVNNAIRTGIGDPDDDLDNPNTLENAVASARAAINRRQVTTDSFDLPVPNENWAGRLALGADGRPGVPEFDTIGDWIVLEINRLPSNDDGDFGIGEPGIDDNNDGNIDEPNEVPSMVDEGDEAVIGYNASEQHTFSNGQVRDYVDLFNAGCDDYVVIMRQDPPQPGRLIDYLKYRVTLELVRKTLSDGTTQVVLYGPNATPRAEVDRLANNVLFGSNLAASDPNRSVDYYSFGGLLAPEVLAGRRMDLNRPFGDGRDNNGNGVVDEPQEAGEPFVDSDGNGLIVGAGVEFRDLDRDGQWYGDTNNNGIFYIDRSGNGAFDGFEQEDIDTNGDNIVDSLFVDHLWYDANGDGVENVLEVRPFDHVNGVDANGSGIVLGGSGTPRIYDDARMTRQLFARHLYCLMLALVDENYLSPYDSDDPQVLHYLDPLSGINRGGSDPEAESGEAYRIAHDLFQIEYADEIADTGIDILLNHTISLLVSGPNDTRNIPNRVEQERKRLIILNRARQIAQRKLTRRTIAQWAINVVDFRDPDSIQTPFEYDENPWDGWNVVDRVNANAVYPIDGDLTTNENLAMVRPVTNPGFQTPDYDIPRPTFEDRAEAAKRWMQRLDQTRGVVWGAERPEVLLTEGVAWHDRRLEDLDDPSITFADPDPSDGGLVAVGEDDDLDQLRKPKGHTYIEAFNPWIGDDQRPAELYSHIDRFGNATENEPGVRLDRLSDRPQDPTSASETRSPVWRIACVEEHPLIRNATVSEPAASGFARPIASALDDPPTVAGSVDAANGRTDSYLTASLQGGPWVYNTDGPGLFPGPGLPEVEILPNAYLDFHRRKKFEADYALLTAGGYATGIGYTGPDFPSAPAARDADDLLVPFGVIETPPTVPDTSFPSFDRFAQPSDSEAIPINISSVVDANGSGQITRGIARKPLTFIERAFYMAAANPVQATDGLGSPTRSAQPKADVFVPDPTSPSGANNGPGLHVPRLVYELDIAMPGRWREEGSQVGVEESPDGKLLIHASKFAAAFDRFGLDLDGDGDADRTDTIQFAPLLPGRRAVIGTAGDIYKVDNPQVGLPTFTGDDAREVANRYVSLISQSADSAKGPPPGVLPGPGDPVPQAAVRRVEMIPHPDHNRHQFMIRMNGLNESLSVFGPPGVLDPTGTTNTTGALNLTSVMAAERADPTLGASARVIAIPIDHFSISEPLDEYFVRQIELDPGLLRYPQPSYADRSAAGAPREEFFAETGGAGDPFPFDEPLDIAPELVENQTTPNYRSLHLERLANPLLPWNPAPIRPDGTPVEQHDSRLPVNPYLPVDARSLDLTAFNSFTAEESNVKANVTDPRFGNNLPTTAPGPEARHRRARSLADASTGALSAARQTVIGFVSNERSRPLGPFPVLWFAQPARLLWRQAGPATFTELAHRYNASERNGYLAEAFDQIVGAISGVTGTLPAADEIIGREGTRFDEQELRPAAGGAGNEYPEQFVDVPWRWTLGFGDWMNGKFFFGSNLNWFDVTPSSGPAEQVDLDGDLAAGDLIGRPEITDDPAYVVGVNPNPHADVNPLNGIPDIIDNTPLTGRPNARNFFQDYLRTLAHDNSTTPELSWPNRPFASSGELMQVPVWGSSRMLTHFSVFNWLHTLNPHFTHRTQVNPYNGEGAFRHDGLDYNPGDAASSANPGTFDGDFTNDGTLIDNDGQFDDGSTNALRFRETLGHFGHLINFFQTARFPAYVRALSREAANPVGAGTVTEEYVVPQGASHFYRLMDYIHVPSRYTATDTLLSPAVFAETGLPIGDAREGLSAPFNRVDSYREPGRVNLNTIVGRGDSNELRDRWSEVYDGLMQRTQDGSLIDYNSSSLLKAGHLGPAWRDVELSRRGYVQPGFDPTATPFINNNALDGDADRSRVAGPSHNAVDYSPRRMNPDFPTLFANPFRAPGEGANVPLAHMVQTGVDATLLRAHPLSPGADGAWGRRGVDDLTVDKSTDGVANNDGNRDDASEAGLIPIELGVNDTSDGYAGRPLSPASVRISSDVVLARFTDNGVSRRGALPDTFLEDAFRDIRIDNDGARGIDPRSVSAQQSLGDEIHNAEISKRATPVALFSGASLEPSLDTERNATLRYLPIQRMSSLTTTRSNVYAVWITVGFFEVKPAREDARIWPRYLTDADGDSDGDTFIDAASETLFNKVYPGGWTLGQEIGIDTGEDRRHRGFYMVDRSRPVAFKPGEDANVSDAILLRRRIQ